MVDEKTNIKEGLEDKKPDRALLQYEKGFEEGKTSCLEKIKEKKCLEQFVEGYKSGFRDGYQSALNDIKDSVSGAGASAGAGGIGGTEPLFGKSWWP